MILAVVHSVTRESKPMLAGSNLVQHTTPLHPGFCSERPHQATSVPYPQAHEMAKEGVPREDRAMQFCFSMSLS